MQFNKTFAFTKQPKTLQSKPNIEFPKVILEGLLTKPLFEVGIVREKYLWEESEKLPQLYPSPTLAMEGCIDGLADCEN